MYGSALTGRAAVAIIPAPLQRTCYPNGFSRMMRLDMPHGDRRPDNRLRPSLGRAPGGAALVVGISLVLAAVLPSSAMGQRLSPPRPRATQGYWSSPGMPPLEQPPVAYEAAMVGFASYEESLPGGFEETADTQVWGEPQASDHCPECGVSYSEPVADMVYCEPDCDACDGEFGLRHRLRALLSRPGRHGGMGRPLHRESWLYRPLSAGWYAGPVLGSPLIGDWIGLESGFLGGYRFGWDQTYHWGGEMRFAVGAVALYDSDQAKAAQQAADAALGLPANDPYLQRFEQRRDANLFQWDLDVLYYPWGDTQWRPYLMMGLGAARIAFTDRLSVRRDDTLLAMPLGLGLKYRCNDWLVLRLECADNMAFGSGYRAVHHLALNGGVEVRFGGARKAYWPWNPGRYYW